jgi:hypothetical protein
VRRGALERDRQLVGGVHHQVHEVAEPVIPSKSKQLSAHVAPTLGTSLTARTPTRDIVNPCAVVSCCGNLAPTQGIVSSRNRVDAPLSEADIE